MHLRKPVPRQLTETLPVTLQNKKKGKGKATEEEPQLDEIDMLCQQIESACGGDGTSGANQERGPQDPSNTGTPLFTLENHHQLANRHLPLFRQNFKFLRQYWERRLKNSQRRRSDGRI